MCTAQRARCPPAPFLPASSAGRWLLRPAASGLLLGLALCGLTVKEGAAHRWCQLSQGPYCHTLHRVGQQMRGYTFTGYCPQRGRKTRKGVRG